MFSRGKLPRKYTGRCVLPPPGKQPGLIVPLDYPTVVQLEKSHEPYPVFTKMFEAELGSLKELECRMHPYFEMPDVTNKPLDDQAPYWENPFFGPMDGRVLYALTRLYNPKRVIEIGSGNSTRFLRKAIREGSLQTKLTSIDPQPRTSINSLVDRVISLSVVDCDLEVFETLESGDFLLLDGSHLAIHGTDVPYFFLRILPLIKTGVVVQIHDIYLPEEYPPVCDRLHYGEQYVLGAFLLNNPDWRVLAPVHYGYVCGVLPDDGVSFWMVRTS